MTGQAVGCADLFLHDAGTQVSYDTIDRDEERRVAPFL